MPILRWSSLLLGVALAPLAAAPARAQMVQPASNPDADALAAQMRLLAANPQDLAALVHAGELALKLGDPTAAASLFARAERIDPHNGRVKAGLGSLAVGEERPGEGLRHFAEAQSFGADPTSFAADRGLAYDLIGEQERAQRDYRLALHAGANDEVSRRYALSLGISGKADQAAEVIEPLLRRGDRAAWRARAFVLAMTGDRAGAEKIATTMLPPGMAQGLAPFFARLPSLGATDRAFAVHFGELRGGAERSVDARMVPPLPALGPDPYPPAIAVAVAPLRAQVAAAKRENKRSRNDRRGRTPTIDVATAQAPIPLPAPPAYVATAQVEPTQIYAPPPVAQRSTRYAHTRGAPSATQLANMASATATAPQRPLPPAAMASLRVPVTVAPIRTYAPPLAAIEPARAAPARSAPSVARTGTPLPDLTRVPTPGASTAIAAATPLRAPGATPAPVVGGPAISSGGAVGRGAAHVATTTSAPPAAAPASAPPTVASIARTPAPNPPAVTATPSVPMSHAFASPSAATTPAAPAVVPQTVVSTPPAPSDTTSPSAPSQNVAIATTPVTAAPAPIAVDTTSSSPPPAQPGTETAAAPVRSEDAILASIIAGINAPDAATVPTPAVTVAQAAVPPVPQAPAPIASPAVTAAPSRAKPEPKPTEVAMPKNAPTEKATVLADRQAAGGRRVSLAALAPRTEQTEDEPPVSSKTTRGGRSAKPSDETVEVGKTRRGAKLAAADTDEKATGRKGKARASADDTDEPPPLNKAEARKAAAAKKLADAKKAADAKQAAEDKAERQASKREPSRIWVQVAGGANEGDLGKAWKGVRGKAPDAFKGRSAYTAPLRATNRVLTGPFKTDAEARVYINSLAKKGISAFPFTSEAGQKVAKIPAE